MLSFEEYFHFDEFAYRCKIRSSHYPTSTLRDNIYQKRRAIVVAGTTIYGGLMLSTATSGTSLLALPLPARKIDVEKQKLRLLEAEWIQRGHNKLPSRTVKDEVIPCLVTGAATAVCYGIDIGIAHAAGDVATNSIFQTAPSASLAFDLGQAVGMIAPKTAKFAVTQCGGAFIKRQAQ